MAFRRRVAERRHHEIIAIEHGGQRYKIGLGREVKSLDPVADRTARRTGKLGPIVEVWLNAQQVNSAADAIASDGAILMSMLLQYGCPAAEIAKSMKRNPNGTPASLFGHAADLMQEVS
jgi:hypothetical protein